MKTYLWIITILSVYSFGTFQKAMSSISSNNLNGKLVVQLGHTQPITQVAYSPNGKFIASATNSGVIKLWSLDGQLIRTLDKFHSNSRFKFTPDSKHILVAYGFGQMELFSVLGKRTVKYNSLKGWMGHIAVSPDNRFVIGCNRSNKEAYCLISTIDGRLIRRLNSPSPKDGDIKNIVFTPDGQNFYASIYKHVYKWTIEGELVKRFKPADSTVIALSQSKDGKHLLTSTTLFKKKYKAVHNEIRLWDSTGKQIRKINTPGGLSAKFSHDGQYIVSGSNKKYFYIHHISGKLIRKIKSGINSTTSPQTIDISPDGQHIVTADKKLSPPGMYVWSFKGKELHAFNQYSSGIVDFALLNGGEFLVTISYDEYIRIWSITGRLVKRFKNTKGWINNVLVSPNQNVIITAGKKLVLWTLDGKAIKTVPLNKRNITEMQFTPDGKALITAGRKGHINIIYFDKNKKTRSFQNSNKNTISSLAVSPNGKLFSTGSSWERFTIWNMKGKALVTYKMPKGTKAPFSQVHAMTFTADNQQLIVATSRKGNEIRYFDLKGNQTDRISVRMNNMGDIKLSPNGKHLAVTVNDNIGIWEVDTKRFVKVLKGHLSTVNRIQYTKNENVLISVSADSTIRVWNTQTNYSYAILADKNEWLIFSSDGIFDSSKHGARMVAMVDGMNLYGVDQFAVYLNRPDVLYNRLGVGSKALKSHLYSRYKHRLARTNINQDATLDSLSAPSVTLNNHIVKGKYSSFMLNMSDEDNLKSYQVYVNDVPIYSGAGKEISGESVELTEKVELLTGKNKIEVAVMNEKGVESLRGVIHANYTKTVKSNLYFIGMGVSKYKDTKLNLKYAHKDAIDLEKHFKKYKRNFNNIHTLVLTDKEVTRESLSKVKSFLAKSETDDVVVISLSGHGAYEVADYSSYYYLSHEVDVNDLTNTAIAYDDLNELLNDVKARRKLMLVDTCASGEVSPVVLNQVKKYAKEKGLSTRNSSALLIKQKYQKPRPYLFMRDRYIYNDLNRRNGAVVFTSAEGGEIAFEHSKIKNGFFTSSVIKSLSSKKTDLNKDGRISITELENVVRANVSHQTKRLQNPIVERDNIYQEFSFPILY